MGSSWHYGNYIPYISIESKRNWLGQRMWRVVERTDVSIVSIIGDNLTDQEAQALKKLTNEGSTYG